MSSWISSCRSLYSLGSNVKVSQGSSVTLDPDLRRLISSRIQGITFMDFWLVDGGVRGVKTRPGGVVRDGSMARGMFVLMSMAMIDVGAI
jgi:hypothetical protein